MAQIEVEFCRDEDGNYILDLTDAIAEAIKEEAEPNPLVEDAGIGHYEYWGIPGYDSNFSVAEVTVEDVIISLIFPKEVSEEDLAGLDIETPMVATCHYVGETKSKGLHYDMVWTGKLADDKRSIVYSGKQG
jgi:hypothetical protein